MYKICKSQAFGLSNKIATIPCLLDLVIFIVLICEVDSYFRYKNQTVAVKIVHKGETPEEIARREGRFVREVAMLSKVQHKNLVKVCLIRSFYLIGVFGFALS